MSERASAKAAGSFQIQPARQHAAGRKSPLSTGRDAFECRNLELCAVFGRFGSSVQVLLMYRVSPSSSLSPRSSFAGFIIIRITVLRYTPPPLHVKCFVVQARARARTVRLGLAVSQTSSHPGTDVIDFENRTTSKDGPYSWANGRQALEKDSL
ncbi:hypothetical protein BC628DRAFT_1390992 [Trametes gibbosa]|nr:hypothetical protein BC628DRAFT_1390992 [Trametes gibbosa]